MSIIPFGYGEVTIPFRHSALAREAAIVFGIDMNTQSGSFQLANKILDDFEEHWAGDMDSNVTVGPVRLAVGQADGTNVVILGTDTFVGGSATVRAPVNCALLITKTSARGGRRGRGRMYLPWVVTDSNVDEVGIITSTDVTAYQGNATDFLAELAADNEPTLGTPMVLLHSESEPDVENPTEPGLPNEVLALTVQNLIGTQRRRLGR